MRTLIYQCWDGEEKQGNLAGIEFMKEYAKKINADHIYDHNSFFKTNLGKYSPNYGKFKCLFDYNDYDFIMYADCDLVPKSNCNENIFEYFSKLDKEFGICEENKAPTLRKSFTIGEGINNHNDERWVALVEKKWKIKLPRTNDGLPKVFNSGMMLWSRSGFFKARKKFLDFKDYVKFCNNNFLPSFYSCDQHYIHAMMLICEFDWTIIDSKWNSLIHYHPGAMEEPRPIIDLRGAEYNFVHIQLHGADNWSKNKINQVVNLPISEWNFQDFIFN